MSKANTKKSTRRAAITETTKLLRKKASCGESLAWDDVLNCFPKRAITFAALTKVVARKLKGDSSYTRRVIGSLRRRGCVAIAG